MKEPDYMMKIMASLMKLDELQVSNTRRDFIYISGTKEIKNFVYRPPFGIYFRYINKVDDHNNKIDAPIL